MNFYCIIENTEGLNRYSLLQQYCNTLGITFILINAEEFNFLENIQLTSKDILLRVTPGQQSKIIEKHLINEHCITFYKDNFLGIYNRSNSYFYNHKKNLPVIKTIPQIPHNEALIDSYVGFLGGFPIVLKIPGGSLGVGIIKVDSKDALISTLDYFNSLGNKNIMMRQFIPHKKQARLVVLGNEVISSYDNIISFDFRSNVGGEYPGRKRETMLYDDHINNITIEAVHSIGIEFGGVDILFDKDNKPHISEVNFPFYFLAAQQVTGVNIVKKMVDYLVNKSKR